MSQVCSEIKSVCVVNAGSQADTNPMLPHSEQFAPNQASGLADFWREFDSENPPFIHPADRAVIEARQGRDHRFDSLEAFVNSPAFGDPGRGLHLHLLPLPFAGDLANADIFILLLNPGFETADYVAGGHGSTLRAACADTIRQRVSDSAFPFFFLDPQFCWSGGYRWWEGKLRGVLAEFARLRGVSYLEALKALSRRMAVLEYFPYSSNSGPEGLRELPSSAAARAYVHDAVLPRARMGELTLVVTRQSNAWGITAQDDNGSDIIVYGGGETRAAHLSTGSRGGKAILKRLLVHGSR